MSRVATVLEDVPTFLGDDFIEHVLQGLRTIQVNILKDRDNDQPDVRQDLREQEDFVKNLDPLLIEVGRQTFSSVLCLDPNAKFHTSWDPFRKRFTLWFKTTLETAACKPCSRVLGSMFDDDKEKRRFFRIRYVTP